MKSTVTDRNVTNAKENENGQVVSLVKNLLSNVEEALSSVYVKMSCVNVETRKMILPNVYPSNIATSLRACLLSFFSVAGGRR